MEGYIKRQEEQGLEPLEEYIELFKTQREQDEENLVNPEWQKDNMEYDLRSTEWICNKVKASESYAQNLYAAMCNRDFVKNDVWPLLKDQRWSASWRHAGGIVADMREEGDYIDWYCSGIRGGANLSTVEYTPKQLERLAITDLFVDEGHVTDEMRADLLQLGWIVIDDDIDVDQ